MAKIKRLGKWGVQVYRSGEREWIGTFDTWREADEAERKAKAEQPSSGFETVVDFAARWTEDYNHGGERWADDHLQNLHYALKPFVAEFGLERLSRFPVDRAAPWASAQKDHVLRAARSLMNDAMRDGLTPRNPFANMRRPRSRGRADILALTEEELHLLVDCARPFADAFHALPAFLLFQGIQGLRPIATAEITPQDVQGDELYVRKPGKRVEPRTVYLFPEVSAALAALPRRLDNPLVFSSPTGRKLTQTTRDYWWNKVRSKFEAKLDPRRAAELRDARPHRGEMQLYELRHTAATLMLQQGYDSEQVAHQLGHTDGGDLVRNLYGHLTDQDRIARMRRSQTVSSDRSGSVVQAR
jgi:integrase